MESEAGSEIYSLLTEMGDVQPEINRTKVSGLFTVKTNLDPHEVIQKIRKIVQDEPWNVRYIQRLIVVDIVINTNISDIKEDVK